ncbi:DUF3085 domain-containing protein [Solwaraspora sp. WMMD1047]|uniref:DUF3085 domain-containing protein n=1 Tax=Solwaraspora sp. WMMD1047 TaxID=3016102 RepID=UPI00241738A6|nr:DUF3085 domain-containing protein [Solwaraspora sp. WMMD1047]MDG4834160.1 DUF3085 domain-containing protein [Solwaraspora sp. WMMD1047]
MALHLYFPLPETLRLAAHATTAADQEPSYTEHTDGIACPGALVWVHDHGVYLMSSGLPQLRDPDDPNRNLIVYADGWNPDLDGDHRDHTHLGDDFAEHIHLTDGDPALIDTLRQAHTQGYRWLRLAVTEQHYDLSVARKRPGQP